MEPTETPQHQHGGIYNYFQGATIHNMVINGNMQKNGTENYRECREVKEKPVYTDEQIANALQAINGKENVLNNYQLWLGACCLLMNRCSYPRNLEMCCDKINGLPFDRQLSIECKYENIRKFGYLKFVREDIDHWNSYQPQDDEKKLFYGCKAVMEELDKVLQKTDLEA